MSPDVQSLQSFLSQARSVVVLSGAGVSTPSGIPDYRDRDGEWKYSQPIQFGEFKASEDARRRYWARSYVGFLRFSDAAPNAAHHALARLEGAGKIDTLITQNVDELHTRAGSRHVIDLHGRLSEVRCMDCGSLTGRSDFQKAIAAANPGWHAEAESFRADGDAQIDERAIDGFVVPDCEACGGTVKPDVVMFGESVPKPRVQQAMQAVERADALLVVGSSLMVFSGYRFARRAREINKPIAIVNQGRTRADPLADVRLYGDCETILPDAVDAALD